MQDIQKYKSALETELDTLINDLERIAFYNKETGDWIAKPEGADVADADENVAADVVEDWNTKRATLVQLETRFNNIKRALKKIEEGTYGVCEISGEPIETDRLDANPAARTCKQHLNDESTLPL